MNLNVRTWNVFHGRDAPPDPRLTTWRSRLTGRPERGTTYIQANRELLPEFIRVLRKKPIWDIALLQECPPRWTDRLAAEFEAQAHVSLTSRNSFSCLRSAIAQRNPDLIASGEGGSNLILVRPQAGLVTMRRELVICPGPRPERRTMAFVELDSGVCIANLHASNDDPPRASDELRRAAETATAWAKGRPLIFGGDFNLRPAETPAIFDRLRERFGLEQPTGPKAIDHILCRGLEVLEAPRARPASDRELSLDGLVLRLSDHAPVDAAFELE